MSSTLTTIALIFNLITGVTYEHPTCPTNAVWQWYPEHGIWACGGER